MGQVGSLVRNTSLLCQPLSWCSAERSNIHASMHRRLPDWGSATQPAVHLVAESSAAEFHAQETWLHRLRYLGYLSSNSRVLRPHVSLVLHLNKLRGKAN